MAEGEGLRLRPVVPGTPDWDAYVDAFCAVFPEDAAGARAFLERYAGYPQFCGRLALWGEEPVGMACGIDAFRGNWWVDRVAQELGADHPALQDAYCVVELGVLCRWRGRGIGSALLQALVASQPRMRAVLSTQTANLGAQRFYLRRGWHVLHPGFAFTAGQEPYCVLGWERPDEPAAP